MVHKHCPQVIRFLIVGAVCAMSGLIIIWLLTGLGGLNYLVSTAIVFITVNPIGYFLNREVTFIGKSALWIQELCRYYTVSLGSLISTLLLSAVLVDGMGVNYLGANAIVAVAMVAFNFVSHKRWTFRGEQATWPGQRK